jgi:hypothetical protein
MEMPVNMGDRIGVDVEALSPEFLRQQGDQFYLELSNEELILVWEATIRHIDMQLDQLLEKYSMRRSWHCCLENDECVLSCITSQT